MRREKASNDCADLAEIRRRVEDGVEQRPGHGSVCKLQSRCQSSDMLTCAFETAGTRRVWPVPRPTPAPGCMQYTHACLKQCNICRTPRVLDDVETPPDGRERCRDELFLQHDVDFPVGIHRAVGASGQANYICGSASAPRTRNFHRLSPCFVHFRFLRNSALYR